MVHCKKDVYKGKRSFRFLNFWVKHPDYKKIIEEEWAIKNRLIRLNKQNFSNIGQQVKDQKELLRNLQKDLQLDPLNYILFEEEKAMNKHLRKLIYYEESFYKQRSRIQWLRLGDSNTKFFHNSIKQRRTKNNISIIKLDNGYLTRDITEDEVKRAVFSIGSEKATGPDGFNSVFFKNSWDIMKQDIMKVVQDAFTSVNYAESLGDFRPISCCNVIYKVISKVLTCRISPLLCNLVSANHSAFIPKRTIAHNIMLAHDLVRNYHIKSGPPRCLLKIDLKKAYD
ncbi:uncharacterized protein LOC126669490 [Mercurialis annua]|uniref:uncharacterized protein LOC126669490 n=1 Tax=Mercurialis annua TaxID=3986 RepID=UPI00215F8D21|nr:uncharacterized protein LOC126669490 [Mercurialis annua]